MPLRNTFHHTTGRHIVCGDAQIYVEEIGDAELPALIMLHGGFGNMEDYNRIAPALSEQFRLIGIDSRGHGKSSIGTEKLSYALMTADLAQVIDVLQLKAFSILGFSDGGIVAYRYAARQDPRLDKIVTVGAGWEINRSDPEWGMLGGMTGEAWMERFPDSYESYMRLNPEPDFDRLAKAVVAMWTDLSPQGRPGDLVQRINNAMLITRGEDDPLVSVDRLEKLGRTVKNVAVVNIPAARHVAFDDAPEDFLQAMGRFFDVTLDA